MVTCVIIVFVLLLSTASPQSPKTLDPIRDQIELYKLRTEGERSILTTSNGAPVELRDTSTLNNRLLYNNFFMDSLTHLTRERIPERYVHSQGAGAFGYFEVTHNISEYTKADFLNGIGKKTPVVVRFSPTVVERGGTDTIRVARGFAVKFYTKQGNFDFVGFNTPMFVLKDPVIFPEFIHGQRRNPATGIRDRNMFWDFLTAHPEAFNMFLIVYGDDGIPKGYRHMYGFSIHTYQFHNKFGKIYFARMHFIPDIGKASLTTEEGLKLDGIDPDSFKRDLYEAIACGKPVTWTFKLQIVTLEQAMKESIDVFDLTIELPEDKFPLYPVGKLVLNRNPVNTHAEVEQLAFCPCNLVPGIDGAPDKVFEARSFLYRDTQLYRLGVNYNRIKVNCPFHAHTYNRDGRAPVGDNGGDSPNYYDNTFNGPMAYNDTNRPGLVEIVQGQPNNTAQGARIYERMSDGEKGRLISNIVDSLRPAIPSLQVKAIKIFTKIHPELGKRVEQALKEYQKEPACTLPFD